MFERLKRLYNAGKITEDGLQYWVDCGIITEEQKREIIEGNDIVAEEAGDGDNA